MSHSSSTADAAANMFNDTSGVFAKMWSEFASKLASAGFTMPQDESPVDMAKQMRNTFFSSWTEACDRYMRSEEFLQMMRESMKAAIDLRRQLNEQLGEVHSAMQGASRQDIDRMMQSIEHLDGRVTETYEQLVECLETVSSRLDAIEGKKKTSARKTTAKRAPAKSKKVTKKTTRKRTKKKAR